MKKFISPIDITSIKRALCNALAIILIGFSVCVFSCKIVDRRLTPIVPTDPDERHELVKDEFLTASSAANQRTDFDHSLHDSIHLMFKHENEPNHYVTESVWIGPDGEEFKKIRKTYDKAREAREGLEREKGGTRRIHTVSAQDLYAHGTGAWTVELYIDGKLARRLDFTLL